MQLLIVDDDQVVLQACKRILDSTVHTVLTASSVSEALHVFEHNPTDLIIVDIKMPEEDGLSLIRKIKDNGSPVPILVMSGYPTSETISTSLATGAKAFLPKPFTPDELIQAIESLVQGETNGNKEDSSH